MVAVETTSHLMAYGVTRSIAGTRGLDNCSFPDLCYRGVRGGRDVRQRFLPGWALSIGPLAKDVEFVVLTLVS